VALEKGGILLKHGGGTSSISSEPEGGGQAVPLKRRDEIGERDNRERGGKKPGSWEEERKRSPRGG